MPRYFFDIRQNDHITVDPDGVELGNDVLAHQEAVRAIAAIASEEIPKDGVLNLTISVADIHHEILFSTHVNFEPGLSHAQKSASAAKLGADLSPEKL